MHLPLTHVARYFKAQGFEVYSDVVLTGTTGAEHAPDLFCEREDGWLLVTVRPHVVRAVDVVDAFVQALDCEARAACHAPAGLTSEAERWAARLGVRVVDAALVRAAELQHAREVEAAFAEAEQDAFPEPAPDLDAFLAVAAAADFTEIVEVAPAPPPVVAEPALVALAAAGVEAFAWPAPVDRVLAGVAGVDFSEFPEPSAPSPDTGPGPFHAAPEPEPMLAIAAPAEPVLALPPAPAPEPAAEAEWSGDVADLVTRLHVTLREQMASAPPAAEPWPLPWPRPVAPRVAEPERPVDEELATQRAFLWGNAERLGDLRRSLESEGANAFGEGTAPKRSAWLRQLAEVAAEAEAPVAR